MKNKRKYINKYLERFEALDTGSVVTYFDNNKNSIEYIWYKKDDKYLQGPPSFKFYSLKEFCKLSIRMLGLKIFW